MPPASRSTRKPASTSAAKAKPSVAGEAEPGKKDAIYWQILNAAIALDFRKGHQRWTISELSRESKITRSLIYYYFGKSRLDILKEAVKMVGEELLGLQPAKLALWEKRDIAGAVNASREVIAQATHLPAFYLTHRAGTTEIGESIRMLETKHFQKLKRFFPGFAEDELRAIWGILFGLAFAPNLSQAAVERTISKLLDVTAAR